MPITSPLAPEWFFSCLNHNIRSRKIDMQGKKKEKKQVLRCSRGTQFECLVNSNTAFNALLSLNTELLSPHTGVNADR